MEKADLFLAGCIAAVYVVAALLSVVAVISDRNDPHAMRNSTVPAWASALLVAGSIVFALVVHEKGMTTTGITSVVFAALYALLSIGLQSYVTKRLRRYGYRHA